MRPCIGVERPDRIMQHVHKKGPSLYYVRHNKWTRLCAANASEDEIYRALWLLKAEGCDTLKEVMLDYIENRLPKSAMSTQKEYKRQIEHDLIPIFGHMRPDDLSSQDIAVHLEKRDREGHGPAGNREIALLSSIYNHGMRIRACKVNPTYGVRRNTELPRTYYVTDKELRVALRTATPALRYLLWATYLTGFRQGDMRALCKPQLTPEGIKVREGKGGRYELRVWSDSLRKVVRRALNRSKCEHVFTNAHGQSWTKDSIGLAMQRLKRKTGAEWNYHDLRAKAESDHDTGLGLMRRYSRVRKLRAVK